MFIIPVTNGDDKCKVQSDRNQEGLTRMIDEAEKTLSVPVAGRRYFDLGKNASYTAAARKELPTIRIGGRLRVPVIALERMLAEAGIDKEK